MKSPAMKWLGMATWAITALAAINVGYSALSNGGNMLHHAALAGIAGPLHYIIGVAGVVSLVLLVMSCTGKKCC